MNEIAKTIRFGTVDFFGIIIPGSLAISTYTIGCIGPIMFFIMDISHTDDLNWHDIYSNYSILIMLSIIVFSYVLGYIIRLSSPDTLDKISAKKVIESEIGKGVDIEHDGWPFDLNNPLEKYPYSKFREYLNKRGHNHLTYELVTWGPNEFPSTGETWPDQTPEGNAIPVTKRSKTTINMMKMYVRMRCPELSGLIESKEGHIRLMAGTWAAFKLSIWPIAITFFSAIFVSFYHFLKWDWGFVVFHDDYPILAFINVVILSVMLWAKRRIEFLFHYRRVSELFHIAQAAYLSSPAPSSNI